MKILFVEDDSSLRKPVRRYLEKKKFVVDEAEDGDMALELITLNSYDCILLDLNLPKLDGIEVSKRIRDMGIDTPVIMVTARSQLYNKLEGFDSGADDYITKPFNLKELVARIDAVIRRSSSNKESELRFGEYILLSNRNVVQGVNGDCEIELSNKEVVLLEYLIRNKGRIVSTEDILEHVWDSEVDVFTDTVKTHIKTLRKKIDPNKRVIKTYRGKGYMLI